MITSKYDVRVSRKQKASNFKFLHCSGNLREIFKKKALKMTFRQGILLHVLQKYKILPKRRGKNYKKIVILKVNDRNREGLN